MLGIRCFDLVCRGVLDNPSRAFQSLLMDHIEDIPPEDTPYGSVVPKVFITGTRRALMLNFVTHQQLLARR